MGRAIPQERVPARLGPVRDQVQIIEDVSKGIVQVLILISNNTLILTIFVN